MKHIFLAIILLTGTGFSFAGNGNGSENGIQACNCKLPNQVNIYAAGAASIIDGNKVQCSGDAGTCWEVVYRPTGGWTLTIFTEPPISFGNSNSQSDSPPSPTVQHRDDFSVVYEWNPDVWKKNK